LYRYITGFTGIDDPYEEPLDAEIVMEVAKVRGGLYKLHSERDPQLETAWVQTLSL
jgi:adenylylsulfate kinase-like enzyme